MRADIDYATSEASTTYGIIGIKVWVFKGLILNRNEQPATAPDVTADDPNRRPRRAAKPNGRDSELAEKPKNRTAKTGTQEAAKTSDGVDGDAKAPAKRVRKAGTTDAAAS